MKKVIVLFLLIAFAQLNSVAQDSLELSTCRQTAIKKYPLSADFNKNIQAYELKVNNIKTLYFPNLNLTGQLIHVSDVPHYVAEGQVIKIPKIGKDQYKIMMEARQLIYDGGIIKKQKSLEETNLGVNNQELKVKLFSLNEQVNDIYFLILLFQEQEKLLQLTHKTLNKQYWVVNSGVQNGVLLPGEADIMKAEIFKLEQELTTLHSGKQNGIELLAELMDTTLSSDIKLTIPNVGNIDEIGSINRPEYKLLDLQQSKLENTSKLNSLKRLPYIGAFGTFGYGYPGLNMLENKANIIYTFGLNLSWNIYDWNKIKREKQIFLVQQDMVNTQKNVFDKNLNLSLIKEKNELKKLDELLSTDDKIIKLRTSVSRTKASQLKNGVITSTDYIQELNEETKAKINKKLHELQKIQTIIKYNTLKGKL